MKKQISNGLLIVKDFSDLSVACSDFADGMKSLLNDYSEEKIKKLSEIYWERIVPKQYLLEKETADNLMAIVPILKELVELNEILKVSLGSEKE